MKSILTRCFVVAACCWSVSASAQSDPSEPTQPPTQIEGECVVDSDCPTNFTCESDNVGVCFDCAEDSPDCSSGCTSESYSYCMPPPPTPCSADSECDGGNVCVSYTFESCGRATDDIACAPDEPCEGPPRMEDEPACESQTEAYCVPRYVAPCQAAADCGPGFTCEAYEQCSCSGTDAPPRDGDTDPAPDIEPNCVCEPSGEQYCQVILVECDTDADCAQDLECVSGPDEGTSASVDPDDGGGSVSPEPTPDSASYCLPPGYAYWGGTSGGDAVAQESGANGTLSTSDRISWGTEKGGGNNSKGSAASCSTIEGDAALSLLGLLGLVGWFRRRR